jgi:hypothetical protein
MIILANHKTRTKIAHILILGFIGIICLTWLIPLVMVDRRVNSGQYRLSDHPAQIQPGSLQVAAE